MKSKLWLTLVMMLTSAIVAAQSPYQCTYNAGFNYCTMQRDGTTRQFVVYIPPLAAPGSGLIVAFSGIHIDGKTYCKKTSGTETLGLTGFVDQLPTPQPVVTCLTSLKSTILDSDGLFQRYWNIRNMDTASFWLPGTEPNDFAFGHEVASYVSRDLPWINSKLIVAHGYQSGALVAEQLAGSDPLFAGAALWMPDDRGANKWPPPLTHPISVVAFMAGGNGHGFVCGTNQLQLSGSVSPWQQTADMHFNDWMLLDLPLTTTSNLNFCTGNYLASGWGGQTTLDYKGAFGGLNKTEILMYKLVNGKGQAYCSVGTCATPVNFQPPPCIWSHPCNSQANATNGSDPLSMLIPWILKHPAP